MEYKLLDNGEIKLGNKNVKPKNEVISIDEDKVIFLANKSHKHIGIVDTDDYCKYSLWANTITYDHSPEKILQGGFAINLGGEHKSLPALIMNTNKGQKVIYANFNRFDIRKKI